jgi:hypothetical protein
MNFERGDDLKTILDDLQANDQVLFPRIAQRILGAQSARGMAVSSPTVALIFQAFRDELTNRGERIVSEIQRVLDGAFIEDFDNLIEALKAELVTRLEACASIASTTFQDQTATIRSIISHPGMPSPTALFEHLEGLKPRLLAEINLFCATLHNSQAPRLLLKAGEVFAGNRAARAIFSAAKQSLRHHRNVLRTTGFRYAGGHRRLSSDSTNQQPSGHPHEVGVHLLQSAIQPPGRISTL